MSLSDEKFENLHQLTGARGVPVRHCVRCLASPNTDDSAADADYFIKLRSDFVSMVSHELRTPLTSIIGFAEFLEDDPEGTLTTHQQGYVQQILESGKSLQRLVDDLLDFSQMEGGTFRLRLREADLGALMAKVLASLSPQAFGRRVSLEGELPASPVLMTMDAGRIEQVLLNLVGNALKFTPVGGAITLSLDQRGDEIQVTVRDTGIGIRAEHVPYLFERFYLVDPSSTRERGGTGLGLSIAKAFVEAHGGRIGVESTPGEGSTFFFSLPRLNAPKARPHPFE